MPTQTDTDLVHLRGLLPLRHLSDAEFEGLTQHIDVEFTRVGGPLFRRGPDDDWLFYLLAGTVRISDSQGDSFDISAGTIEALHPLSTHPKARVHAQALSALRYVKLPASLLASQRRAIPREGIQVSEAAAGEDTVDNELLFSIYQALREERLVLPTLPDVALRIRAAAADPLKGADAVARIILADPALASYCLRAANSAVYAGAAPITEVTAAVTRMGVETTRDFILAQMVRNLFRTSDPRCTALMRAAWTHSANIAALCFVLSKRLGVGTPEQALLTGLLHDIGVLVLVSQLDAFPQIFNTDATLQAALQDLRPEVTGLVLRAWRLPESLTALAIVAEQWSRPATTKLGISEILLLAHWHEPRKRFPWAQPIPPDGAAVLQTLPPEDFTANGHLKIVLEAREELAKLRALLGG
ncbi:MAG: HDOD domain-containing protein [Gammaproteobacteria bacterium]|nr:HDOD domain-containing protein [Gammaproteobacteria bacterium]